MLANILRLSVASTLVLSVVMLASPLWALNLSIPAIGGDQSRQLLGDGTGVIVGIIDSGVDDTHPALSGLDSLGQPRLVAEANFVTTEAGNTGDDVAGHGTWVSSVVLGDDPGDVYDGLATDARYINARVLNNSNGFSSGSWVENGVGFAIDQGADILNLSLNYFAPVANGQSELDQMLDWAASERGIHVAACAGNISQAQSGYPQVRGPGSLFNGFSVGRTDGNFDQVHSDSATAFTQDGRMKPDLVAPGTSITMANDDHETQNDWTSGSGCSFATPHVAGLLAQWLDYGRTQGLETSPLLSKATFLNSADHDGVVDKSGSGWEPANATAGPTLTVTQPLDTDMGAGQIDSVALYEQYAAGEYAPGLVDELGWDYSAIGQGQVFEYEFDGIVPAGETITTTLTWFRHVSRTDDGNGILDAADSFSQLGSLDNLDLSIKLGNDVLATSVSTLDNLQHLQFTAPTDGQYSITVTGTGVFDDPSETFALAWSTTSLLGVCAIGDADCDGDVDISDDILTAFSNFTGPGSFGKLRAEGDVEGNPDGNTPTANAPADGDVDVSDLLTMFGNFTGPLDENGLATPAALLDPSIPDLIYNAATGEVILDPDGSSIIGYSLKSVGAFLAGGHTPILGGVSTSLSTELAEAALSSPGSAMSIGLVLPAGLDLAGLTALFSTNEVSRSLGAPIVPFDLIVIGPAVPEPSTYALAAMGLVGLGCLGWRRHRVL